MAILKLQLIGVVIFLISALEAQEAPTTTNEAKAPTNESVANNGTLEAQEAPTTTNEAKAPTNESVANNEALEAQETPTTESITTNEAKDKHLSESSTTELDTTTPRRRRPLPRRPLPRHVKAHDGFHNLLSEKNWAHWNDAFTTPHL